jgi:4-hydroxy-tetrahydrodipicolinate synthase
MPKKPEGILALLATPFKDDYSLNLDALRQEIDWSLNKGADGVIVAGSVGEFIHLSDEERKDVFKTCMDQVKSNAIAVAGASAVTTIKTIEFCNYAKDLGFDAAMVIPPYYWGCTEDEVYKHYEMVSNLANIPIIIYHNPALSKFYMKPEFMAKLVKLKNMVAIKEVLTDITHIERAIELTKHKVSFLQYSRAYTYARVLGAKGGTIDPFLIKTCKKCDELLEKGDILDAIEIQKKIDSLFVGGEEVLGILGWYKYALTVTTGIDVGPPRPPYLQLTDKQKEEVKRKLEELGLIEQ